MLCFSGAKNNILELLDERTRDKTNHCLSLMLISVFMLSVCRNDRSVGQHSVSPIFAHFSNKIEGEPTEDFLRGEKFHVIFPSKKFVPTA